MARTKIAIFVGQKLLDIRPLKSTLPMNERSSYYPPASMLILFLALVLLFVPWLGETLFNSKGEPREAIVAVSILDSGNWILPTNYGGDIPFKPPFLAWLIAGFAWLFNGGVVNEYLSRLPSVVAAIAMVMGGYVWCKRRRGTRFALIYSFVTILSFEVFRAAMACRLDMVLTACMVGAMYIMQGLYVANSRTRFKFLRWLAVWVLLTCAVMTKGPVGSLLPCFILGVYGLLIGRRFFPTLFQMLGMAIAALILPALWAYLAYLQGGQHFFDLMWEENMGRLLGTMSYESHVQPFWYNFVTLIAGFCPWTLAVIFALFCIRKMNPAGLKQTGLFCACAAILTILFYTIPESKRSVYLLPAYPFIAYAIASILNDMKANTPLVVFTWLIAILAICVPVVIAVAQFLPIEGVTLESIPWWKYIFVVLPMFAGISWIVNRHSPLGYVVVIIWTMYLAYISAIMPSVLNPRSDYKAVESLPDNVEIISLIPESEKAYRLYTINFYENDRLRAVSTIEEAEKYPAGTILLIPQAADTTGLSKNFIYKDFLKRSCDYRRPVGMAQRR